MNDDALDADIALAEETCTVAVVGGGTAGLALAAELMRLRVGKVVVLERETAAGGIPRHCGHYPFGLREYARLLKGPDYARRNVRAARDAGVDIRTGTTVTHLRPGGVVDILQDGRRKRLRAARVALCTGIRESSRAQRFIAGDRPGGVISTGALQSMVYLKGIAPFRNPVIMGSELVSFSAIQTCVHLGIQPAAMVEEHERIVARRMLTPYLWLNRIPLHTGARNPRIGGAERVEWVEYDNAAGNPVRIDTDGIIVSGRFRPEAALLRSAHLDVDPGTGGPLVDQFARCSDPAYFAAGNVLRPAETSGFCWSEGIATARRVAHDLARPREGLAPVVPIAIADPAIGFVMPQRLTLSGDAGGMEQLYLGLNGDVNGVLVARSGNRTLWSGRVKSRPVRRLQIPLAGIVAAAPSGQVEIDIEGSR